jgi:hypothetical protein
MQIGTIFQIVALRGLPDFHQPAIRSITLLGITQEIPNRENMLFHRADATSQWCISLVKALLSLNLLISQYGALGYFEEGDIYG